MAPDDLQPPGAHTGWTVDTLRIHHEALREGDERFLEERDRRYAEVATEREKALKIKETADLAALGLAREIQTYKDEKANELRSQIERERVTYATKTDLTAAVEKLEVTIKPVSDYVTGQSGPRAVTSQTIFAALAALGVLGGLWLGAHGQRTIAPVIVPPTTVTVPRHG